MNEDELVLGVDVRLAEGEQLLRACAAQEWGKDKLPVTGVDGVQEVAGFVRRNPATLPASPDGLESGIRRINSGPERGVGFDPMLTQRVSKDRGEAGNGAIDRRFGQSAREQRSLDVMNVLASDLGDRAVLATRQMGIDIRLDPRAMSRHRPWIAPNSGGP
jgi:hypothetical protein